MSLPFEHCAFHNGGIELHAVAAGPAAGPLAILLHGFPEFWYSWHRQIEPLASAGFRVIVPDQRGYNKSSKPHSVASYSLPLLVSDVLAIADYLDRPRFCLAGHDWGAAVAWSAAITHPHRLHKLAILNVPHPSVMLRFVKSNFRQLRRSWYMFFFQLPLLPEAAFSAFDFRLACNALVRSSRPGTFSVDDLSLYRAAWSEPGALRAMINWYRALPRNRAKFSDPTVRVPTRILWGMRDAFLLSDMAQASLSYCASAELYPFAEASHWLQHEEPARVAELLINFFRS